MGSCSGSCDVSMTYTPHWWAKWSAISLTVTSTLAYNHKSETLIRLKNMALFPRFFYIFFFSLLQPTHLYCDEEVGIEVGRKKFGWKRTYNVRGKNRKYILTNPIFKANSVNYCFHFLLNFVSNTSNLKINSILLHSNFYIPSPPKKILTIKLIT